MSHYSFISRIRHGSMNTEEGKRMMQDNILENKCSQMVSMSGLKQKNPQGIVTKF